MDKSLQKMNLQLFAEENLTVTGDLAKVQSIDFANRFGENITKLLEALGVTRKIPMASGMVIKTYKAVKNVKKDKVGEGEVIPLSKVETKPDKTYEIELKKFRKAVSGEAIQRHGFDQAVAETDELLLKEIQKDIRADLFTFLATGTGRAEGVGLQAALAQAWGQVQTLFEDDAVNTIAFVNPLDVANYNGDAKLTIQKEFGLTFVEGFTDVTVITNTSVPKGKIYATAPENVVFAYIPVTGSELGKTFNLTSDETGYIGITHNNVNNNVTVETLALSGATLFAERLDGVVVVGIKEPEAPPIEG
ncbi:hypothetical protein [Anaerosalibacter massiliensis]|uniref:Phage capsid family protein n=1 Tax=Anaerosalibacter massiliensis TaxID=1347392 RepID=A0A9X2MLT2_9FIRM|nr:hypothetical protein [Anaerosalibacter massiliensis]MCR2045492.1 hypothetical protein [Anaerosalibacter massiliensis]